VLKLSGWLLLSGVGFVALSAGGLYSIKKAWSLRAAKPNQPPDPTPLRGAGHL